MKNMILILSMLLFLTGCSEEEQRQQQLDTSSIFGTWQLVEKYDGGSLQPKQLVENGYLLSFDTSGSVITTDWLICDRPSDSWLHGGYSIQEIDNQEAVIFEFFCPKLNKTIPDIERYVYFRYDSLILTPTNRVNTCDEGCSEKFKKIAEGLIETKE